jgi:hypothetical protein
MSSTIIKENYLEIQGVDFPNPVLLCEIDDGILSICVGIKFQVAGNTLKLTAAQAKILRQWMKDTDNDKTLSAPRSTDVPKSHLP